MPNASRRTDVVACESGNDRTLAYASRRSDADDCEIGNGDVGKAQLASIALTPSGSDKILQLVQGVAMLKSARRAITGDGVCIGVTYKEDAVVHPKNQVMS